MMMVSVYEVTFHNCSETTVYPSVYYAWKQITVLHNTLIFFFKIPVYRDVPSELPQAPAFSHCCDSPKFYSYCQANHISDALEGSQIS
jgi:hypothetical protein